jgi:WS/DGAT/MGAT family acyltransferase
MHQLSGVDAGFLNVETPTAHGHIGSLALFDTTDGAITIERLKELVASRLHELAPLRQRLMTVPWGIDRPYWVEDDAFDLDFHVRHIAVPPPGRAAQLADLVGRLHARPLDRRRPLWELHLIDGLANGRCAQYTKIHLACIDATTGTEIFTTLLDDDPNGRAADPEAVPWSPDRSPSPGEMLTRGLLSLAFQPGTALRLGRKMGSVVTHTVRRQARPTVKSLGETIERVPVVGRLVPSVTQADDLEVLSRPPLVAPRVSFNKSISAHRRFAFTSVPLDDLKAIKRASGVTLNDVAMAVCAGALRTWLAYRQELPTDALLALVPVTVQADTRSGAKGNRVSVMVAALPTNEADPLRRLALAHDAMAIAKKDHAALPAEFLQDLGRFAPPAVAARVARLVARSGIADYGTLPFNLVISNIPGPQYRLYCAGVPMLGLYPVPTISDGAGLSITLASYDGQMNFGALACRDAIDDLWPLASALDDAVRELYEAAAEAPGI